MHEAGVVDIMSLIGIRLTGRRSYGDIEVEPLTRGLVLVESPIVERDGRDDA